MFALASAVLAIAAASAFAAPGDTNRISSGGTAQHSSLSDDGRFIAFELYQSGINYTDVFVVERATGTIEKVSVAAGGGQADNNSYEPSLSADGRYVSFHSYASNLVAGDTNFAPDVFVYDRQTDTTERVSVGAGGVQAATFGALQGSISADGNRIAFRSQAATLVPGDTNGTSDVFVRDRQANTTERISVATGGAQGNAAAIEPSISADGRYVAFSANSSNLVPGDTNNANDIFVRDLQAETTERVSLASSGVQANLDSFASGDTCCGRRAISTDGRFVAFQTSASNLVAGDDNNTSDVFVRDRQTNETSRVNVSSAGLQANGPSLFGAISADGRHVVFTSLSSNLISPPDTNVRFDAFAHDRQTGVTTRFSVATGGGQGNAISIANSISGDGRYVSFESDASNLVSGDTSARDVFIHERDVGPSSFTLTVERSGTGEGSVASDPAGIICGTDCSADFVEDSVVTLVAEAASGSTFSGWSGGGCSGTGDCTVTMDQAVTVTADFTGPPPPPDTIITTGASATNAGVAFFQFTADPPAGATFECSLDGEPFAACTSPYTSPVIDPGAHSFDVRASNANGTDATPATRFFIVDRVAPTTTIRLSGNQVPSGAFLGSATVDADVTDPPLSSGIRNRFCLVDPPTPPTSFGSFGSQPCGVVVTAVGTHTAYAIANDEAGNASAIVSATFSIVAAPDTTITEGPSGVVFSVPSFRFTSTVAGSRFECRIDSGPYTPCSSAILAYKVFGLSQGAHTFEVRAIGPDGIVDPSPASRTFTIGTQALDGGCSFRFPFGGSATHSCVAKRAVCPLGSVCTRVGEVNVVNEDIGISYAGVVSQPESEVAPSGSTTKPLGFSYGCSAPSFSPFTKGPCPGSWTATVIGKNQPVAVVCGTYLLGNYTGASTPLPGPDEARGITCDATITIRPATALEAAATGTGPGTGVSIVVPGPGILGVAPLAVARSSAAGRAAPKPPFKTITSKIKSEGVKELKLNLGPAERKTLRTERRLELTLDITFTPTGGASVSRTQTVVLTTRCKPTKKRPFC